MCSIDPDEITDMVRETEDLNLNVKLKCKKCDNEDVQVVLRKTEVFCRECFLVYFVHKFRSTIGKSKMIKAGDEVAVIVSEQISSVALVHLVLQGISDQSGKKLRFKPTFIFIDEACLKKNDNNDALLHSLCGDIEKEGFQCHICPLESVMDLDNCKVQMYKKDILQTRNEDHVEKLHNLLNNCKSNSSKEDILYRLKMELVCKVCSLLNLDKLFLDSNSTSISIKILGDVAQGRGAQLSKDVHFKTVHTGVEVYRPMREILESEIIHYLRLQDVPYSTHLDEANIEVDDILQCSKKFVLGLQKDFPATIPTIFRTGDKLVNDGSVESDDNETNSCLICGNYKDTNKSESSALYATIISHKLSNMANKQNEHEFTNSCEDKESSCGGGCACSSSTRKRIEKNDLTPHLCYSCRIIVREMDSINSLPPAILEKASALQRNNLLREEIGEFLLE